MRLSSLLLLLIAGTVSAQSYTVSGLIREDATRIPVPLAQVAVLTPAGDTLASMVTGSDGQYQLDFEAPVGTSAEDDIPELATPWADVAYPNPVRGRATIRYRSLSPDAPALELYDANGRRLPATATLPAGVYFYRLRYADGAVTEVRSFTRVGAGTVDFRLEPASGPQRAVVAIPVFKSARFEAIVSVRKAGYQPLDRSLDVSAGSQTLDPLDLARNLTVEEASESTFDVTFDPATVRFDDAARAAVVEADTVAHRYVFDQNVLQTNGISLEAGSVMWLSGIALRRVTSAQKAGGQLIVETEPATLADAVTDGEIGWAQPVDFNLGTLQNATVYGKGGVVDLDANKITFEYKANGYGYKIEIEPKNGFAKMKCTVTRGGATGTGGATAALVGEAELKQFTTKANAKIENKSLTSFSQTNEDMKIDMKLSIAAVGAAANSVTAPNGGLDFRMPDVAIPLKFLVGGIPIEINIRVQAVIILKVIQEASVTAEATFSYSSTNGFEYNGTNLIAKHSNVAHNFGSGTVDPAALIGNSVDAQIGVAFPRFEVKAFGVPVVPYLLTFYALGASLTWGPVCKAGYVRTVAAGGVDIDFFGAKNKLLETQFFEERRDFKGDSCPSEPAGKRPVDLEWR